MHRPLLAINVNWILKSTTSFGKIGAYSATDRCCEGICRETPPNYTEGGTFPQLQVFPSKGRRESAEPAAISAHRWMFISQQNSKYLPEEPELTHGGKEQRFNSSVACHVIILETFGKNKQIKVFY